MNSGFWLPAFTLWRRELIRFWREKARVAGFVGSPLVFWLVIGSGFGNLAFFFPGALTLTVMFSAVFSTMSLIEDRREGFLLSMLVSPAPRSAMVLGKVMGSATLAWIQGLIFLAFFPLAGFRPSAVAIVELVAVLFLISFTFTSLGFLLAWQMDSTQGFHAVINLLLFPLWMVSGAIFSIESAHGWMQVLMRMNPLTYSLSLVRHFLERGNGEGLPPLATSLVVSLATGIALWMASTFVASQRTTRNFG
ncbi:MAG TPA: ABC transporter permease [Bryobacteraceae bacterium]|nr:ABC transporter permease [Bryobacteraceae bacterium]